MEEDKKYRFEEEAETGREGQATMSANKPGKLGGSTKPRKSKNNAASAAAGSIGNVGGAASSSAHPGGSKKRSSVAQGQGFEGSSVAGRDIPLDEEEDMGQHVNQILSQLGTQIQNRVRAKKQKLNTSFQAVHGFLENVHSFQKEQAVLRLKMIEEFQRVAGTLNGKLNDVIQMQHRNEEKQGKMMIAVTRENGEVKQLVSQCSQIQNSIFDKFFKESDKLVQDEGHEAALETEQGNKEINTLQKKLVAECQKEGSEMFSRFGI